LWEQREGDERWWISDEDGNLIGRRKMMDTDARTLLPQVLLEKGAAPYWLAHLP
jgi:hypothetical protein